MSYILSAPMESLQGEDDEQLLIRSSIAKWSRYYYDGRVHVIPEFDGIRIITNESYEFLHKVTGKPLKLN